MCQIKRKLKKREVLASNLSRLVTQYNKELLCYNIRWSLFPSRFVSNFCPIPALYAEIPTFYAAVFLFIYHCSGNLGGKVPVGCIRSLANGCTRAMHERGRRVGSRWWWCFLCECARKIILAHNLLRQADTQSWVPIHLPVPQGTGEASSTYHTLVWPSDRNCDIDVDPTTLVWNGLLDFFCHELT